MSETPAQYTARILSNIGDADPWAALQSTAARLRQLVSGRTDEALAAVPAPGRWSVREILAHLADVELVTAWRLRSILAANGTTLQAFDQDRWAETFRYSQQNVADSLETFEVVRRANLRLLRSVEPVLWENYGQHEERGRESIAHLTRLYAGHDLNHIKQVEQLVAAMPTHA